MNNTSSRYFFVLILFMFLKVDFSIAQHDIVHGNLIQFNDNGLWCWFQDERAIVDQNNGLIILGTDESQSGYGGPPRNGIVRAIVYNLQTGTPNRFVLRTAGCDDHNVPGFILRPDGKPFAMYSDHYDNYNRYRIFNGNSWSTEQRYDWSDMGGSNYTIAYNNLYYLSNEGKMYDFSRANNRAPNFIISDDMGNSWSWGGQLTTNTSNSYNKGYYKYWSNGKGLDVSFPILHQSSNTPSCCCRLCLTNRTRYSI